MSSEAGGGLIGAFILLAVAGPLVAAALAAVATGAVVIAAVSAATRAARAINDISREKRRTQMEKNIGTIQRSAPVRAAPAALRTAEQSRSPRAHISVRNATPHAVNTAAEDSVELLAKQRQQQLDLYLAQSHRLDDVVQEREAAMVRFQRELADVKAKGTAGIRQVQQQADALAHEMDRALAGAQAQFAVEQQREMAGLETDIAAALQKRRAKVDAKLDDIADKALREQRAIPEAESLYREAQALFAQLQKELDEEPDWRVKAAFELTALQTLQRDCRDLLARRMGQAAVAGAVSFVQQTMETFHKLDQERYRLQLIDEQIALRAAQLRAEVENGTVFEKIGRSKLPTDADYWAGGALAPVLQKAKALLAKVDGKTVRTAAEAENLLQEISVCTASVEQALQEGRQAYVCCYSRIAMMAKAKSGFTANGWVCEGTGFEKDEKGRADYRRPMVMRFRDGTGATADLLLSPARSKDALGNVHYDVQVTVERHDRGVVDERNRHAQLEKIRQGLQQQGLPVEGLHCTGGTEGKNSAGPVDPERFAMPGNTVSGS